MPINSFLYPGAKFLPAYEVANSCRFNDGDSAYMSRTLGTPTDPEKWTWSCWVKRSNLGATQDFMSYDSGSTLQENFAFDGDDNLRWYHRTSGGTTYHLKTNRKFRDVSAWYHLLIVYDSSQASSSNRVKFFVNGTQETSFATSDYPAQDVDSELNKANAISLYRWAAGSEYFDGYIAENVFCDGQAYTTTDFGEFDEDSPTIWKPIDVSGLTFGTNGFYLDFEDSSNLGNDANGGTDWSETNLAATDQATDTPTNNFSTWNSLYGASNLSYAQGNTEISCSSDGWFESGATIGISTGKWYYELKCTLGSGTYSSESIKFGICDASRINDGSGETQRTENHYQADGNSINDDTMSGVGTFATYTTNDIIGCAVDMTNRKIYYHKNGTYINSGNPSSGSNGFDISSSFDFVLPTISMYESGTKGEVNFGNPSFSISSGNADADGYGNFEYSVPSGFYALCTKNLAEYG